MLHFDVKKSNGGDVKYAIVKGVTASFLRDIILVGIGSNSFRTELLNMELSKTCGCMYTFNSGAKLYVNSEIGNFVQGYAWDSRDCFSAMEELKQYYYDYQADKCFAKSRAIMGYSY